MKKLLLIILLVALCGAVYWYGTRSGWFLDTTPSNLPTAEERDRMDAVEEAASEIDPNATAGAGVVPKGSKSPAPVIVPDEPEEIEEESVTEE